MTPHRPRQHGFSLMELLIAMVILGVIATLGFKGLTKSTDKARHIQGVDKLRTVSQGLDQYYLNNGKYPDFSSWEQMIDANSPLVKKNLIPVDVPKVDGWGQPFEGTSGKGKYELKFAGNPNDQDDYGPRVAIPGRGIYDPNEKGAQGAEPTAAAPAPGAAK